MNISSKGTKTTIGIPGTGLSHQSYAKHESNISDEENHNNSNTSSTWKFIFFLIGGLYLVTMASQAYGGTLGFIAFLLLSVCYWFYRKRDKALQAKLEWEEEELRKLNHQNKWNNLKNKYGNEETCQLIMDNKVWQGQTSEQLLDAIGNPQDIDEKVLKTKRKEIWKYDWQSSNRYNLKIILENDIVVGWERK